jgi:hypothetical protein
MYISIFTVKFKKLVSNENGDSSVTIATSYGVHSLETGWASKPATASRDPPSFLSSTEVKNSGAIPPLSVQFNGLVPN